MLNKKILYYSTATIIAFYFLFVGLSSIKDVLSPLLTAIILTLMVLPLANRMEVYMKRAYSSLINTFLLFFVSIGLLALLSFQIKSFADNWPQIKEKMKPKVEQLEKFIVNNTPVNASNFDVAESGKEAATGAKSGEIAVSFLGWLMSFVGQYLLTFVYIFFLLNYRKRFKVFLYRLFPDEQRDETEKTLYESANVVQQYLVGKFLLIIILAVLYSVGLGISGVRNFILISLIAALFDLVPYVGNIIGFAMAMAFGYLSTGSTSILIGIIITFSVAQFVQTYVLQPYVVGDKVDVHPFFTVLVVIIGNAVWGVIGMILAIPVLAIITIIFLHVPPLKPFGYLFSNKKLYE